ncbi:MAG: hypothetical protein ACRDZ3_03380 [Acidimicrobiia bacterium]
MIVLAIIVILALTLGLRAVLEGIAWAFLAAVVLVSAGAYLGYQQHRQRA